MKWDEMKYWQSGEWQVVQEKLDELDKAGIHYNPDRSNLFRALDGLDFDDVRVVIVGQDPYPDSKYATGLAFSVPNSVSTLPPTLVTMFKEYENDLHLPFPKSGNLEKWANQGVLLWNAIPSCQAGKSLSHDWNEWSYLTKEIIECLSTKGGVVFAFLGSVARRYARYVDTRNNGVLEASHPSPRGNLNSNTPFSGSRIFTSINGKLKLNPIDWKIEALQPVQHEHGVTKTLWETDQLSPGTAKNSSASRMNSIKSRLMFPGLRKERQSPISTGASSS